MGKRIACMAIDIELRFSSLTLLLFKMNSYLLVLWLFLYHHVSIQLQTDPCSFSDKEKEDLKTKIHVLSMASNIVSSQTAFILVDKNKRHTRSSSKVHTKYGYSDYTHLVIFGDKLTRRITY